MLKASGLKKRQKRRKYLRSKGSCHILQATGRTGAILISTTILRHSDIPLTSCWSWWCNIEIHRLTLIRCIHNHCIDKISKKSLFATYWTYYDSLYWCRILWDFLGHPVKQSQKSRWCRTQWIHLKKLHRLWILKYGNCFSYQQSW